MDVLIEKLREPRLDRARRHQYSRPDSAQTIKLQQKPPDKRRVRLYNRLIKTNGLRQATGKEKATEDEEAGEKLYR